MNFVVIVEMVTAGPCCYPKIRLGSAYSPSSPDQLCLNQASTDFTGFAY